MDVTLPTEEIGGDCWAVGQLERWITCGNISYNDDARTNRHEDGDHHCNDHEESADDKRRSRNRQLQCHTFTRYGTKLPKSMRFVRRTGSFHVFGLVFR